MDRSLPNTSRQPQKFTRVTLLDSVRVARQMRDAYGLKPKDRPAMYVKCKVPDFERNVAQVRAHGFFLAFLGFDFRARSWTRPSSLRAPEVS